MGGGDPVKIVTTNPTTYIGEDGQPHFRDDAEQHPWVPGGTFKENPELLPMLRLLEESGVETAEELRIRLFPRPNHFPKTRHWDYPGRRIIIPGSDGSYPSRKRDRYGTIVRIERYTQEFDSLIVQMDGEDGTMPINTDVIRFVDPKRGDKDPLEGTLCQICQASGDHGGLPHGEVTGDGRRRTT